MTSLSASSGGRLVVFKKRCVPAGSRSSSFIVISMHFMRDPRGLLEKSNACATTRMSIPK